MNCSLEKISIGNLLKKAAAASFANITLIGCYMAFFAVLLAMLREGGLLLFLLRPLYNLGLPAEIAAALAAGLWEMSLGIEQAAQVGSLAVSLPVIAAILAWGGLSVQAQVAAMVADTDIPVRTYFITRIGHALLSFGLAWVYCFYATIPTLYLSLPGSFSTLQAWQTGLTLLGGSLLALGACCMVGKIINVYRRRQAGLKDNCVSPRGFS